MDWNNVGIGQVVSQALTTLPWIGLCVFAIVLGLRHDRTHPTAARRLIAGSAVLLLARLASSTVFLVFLASADRSRWIAPYSVLSLLVSLLSLVGTALIIAAVFAGRRAIEVS
jgi:hypothetical protein